jgi:hypothetical protein
MATLVVNTGLAHITNRIKGVGGTEPLNAAWGSGGGTTAAGDTTLFTEELEDRVAGTSSQETTSVTNDTYQVVATITAGSPSKAITNAGLFDSTTPPGTLFMKGDFGTINLNQDDSIQFTFKVQFS